MYEIKTMNNIAQAGLNVLGAKGIMVNVDSENPDALLIRSAKLHDMVFGDKLLAVGRAGVGVDNVPIDRCTEQGVVVFNAAGANAQAVVELAVCSLILASRNIMDGAFWAKSLAGRSNIDGEVEAGKKNYVGPEIMGKTLGIIGLGNIGSRIANAAIALGMNVIGYDPYMSVESAWRISGEVRHAEDLGTVYRNSDYVLIQLHLTDKTRGMLGAEAFRQMKDGVRIINLARGGLVDTDAIMAAIASGKVARYVTDFPDDKLIGTKGVVAFPHLGASTPESEEKCAVMAAQELADYLMDGNTKNAINLPDVNLDRAGEARICVIHMNVPRMINGFLDIIGEGDLNVAHMINKARGDIAYTIIDVDSPVTPEMKEQLEKMDHVKRVRIL